MSYHVLARKWRPRSFKDMVGQEHILRMLGNALEQKRLHHAYLLTGTRGVGKTTLGRILAKCLNCETGITKNPCGECHACKSIDAGQFLDLYEVDAASRTKVEDTRELLDNVLYPPTMGRYKVYLIDEVHMLSNHSFNALLKTLEEPPEHVKFILATTDPKRLPVTILSRCLQFHLKRITPAEISAHLQTICKAESFEYEDAALQRLAKAADGSLRDALSLLDQAIAYGQGTVKADDVNAMLGNMTQDDVMPLIHALAVQDGRQMLDAIAHLSECSPDYQQLLEELTSLFHQIALLQCIPTLTTTDEAIAALAKSISAADIQLYYQIALLAKRDLDLAPGPLQGFEMAMLRMLAMRPVPATQTVSTESRVQEAAPKPASAPKTVKSNTAAAPAAAATAPPAAPTSAQDQSWAELLPKLELSGMSYALAANCQMESITASQVTLSLSQTHQPMLNVKLQERIAEALTRHFKQPMKLEIKLTTSDIATPIKQLQQEQKQQLASAKQNIMQDPKVKELIEMYDATVDVTLLS